ncbi:SGNH/GDSL hydrolase family protein [Methylomonas rapida]|uniref:SGNH hydrolase-type esterase domain-containing protein n=1 Tax=Methylomonas rapida TaxID=2963939 RepID=A0ABY7GLU5_9GAMM|nr:hypothetical protein [Methylomonas rapida]WAR43599.1 hypothetical protein NM686_014590 [Methylomonas rapida]WAR45470.1 hypothetical protein NM686_002860 [Methylomonas rapida]
MAEFETDGGAAGYEDGMVRIKGILYLCDESRLHRLSISNPKNKVAIVGDSFDERAKITDTAGSLSTESYAVWNLTNLLMSQRLDFIHIDGISGTGALTGASVYRNRIGAAIASGAHWCALRASVNDFNPGTKSFDELVAEYSYLFATLNAAGMRVISNTVGPSNQLDTTAKRSVWAKFNQWMLHTAPRLFDVVVIPQHYQCADPDVLTGAAKSTLAVDGLHPDLPGAFLIAQTAASVLDPYLPNKSPLFGIAALGTADETAIDPNSINIGTSGAKGANVTGNVANGFSIRTTANGGTAVASKVARTDGPGYWQQVVWTPDGAGKLLDFYSNGSAIALNAGFAIGDVVQYLCEIEVDAGSNPANVHYPYILITFAGANKTAKGFTTNSIHPALNKAGWRGVIATPKMAIPDGTTGIYIQTSFYSKIAAEVTVRFGQHAMINHSKTLA